MEEVRFHTLVDSVNRIGKEAMTVERKDVDYEIGKYVRLKRLESNNRDEIGYADTPRSR